MVEGRQRVQWQHTASLMALLANIHRDAKKSESFTPSDFDPFAERAERPKVSMSLIFHALQARQNPVAGKSNPCPSA
jgi:hypothetical protein